jgi:perosamine synthetase
MNVDEIKKKISKRTSAIMIVHIYGITADVGPILAIAKSKKLKVIEDAAEMHGQEYKGNKCGTFGDVSTFSFYVNKHITTGEGGMILTNKKKIYEEILKLKKFVNLDEKTAYGERYKDDLGNEIILSMVDLKVLKLGAMKVAQDIKTMDNQNHK